MSFTNNEKNHINVGCALDGLADRLAAEISAGVLDAGAVGTAEIADDAVTFAKLDEGVLQSVSVTLTATQMRNLNATPVELVAAPGANKVIVPIRAVVSMDYNANVYDNVGAGDDLTIKYTDAGGDVLFFMETAGMLDQANDEEKLLWPASAAATPLCEQIPVANAALVANVLVGEIAAADLDANGDSPVTITVVYQVVASLL